MRHPALIAALALTACSTAERPKTVDSAVSTAKPSEYLYVWSGDSARKASDFLAVIDASPTSPSYGQIVAAVPSGTAGSSPHHTEDVLGPNSHLLANGFGAGETWLYDLSVPKTPTVLTSFTDRAGLSNPHSFTRLPNGNVLATFQYAGHGPPRSEHAHGAAPAVRPASPPSKTGGLVEMTERGDVVRSGSAADTTIADRLIYPYSVLPLPRFDRALSTTTDMDDGNVKATSQWVQLWRLSDLKLLHTVALPPGPRGDEQKYSGEPRLRADGRSAFVHTFNCGLYLVRGLDTDSLVAQFVYAFEGINCGVPVLAGHYWVQTVPKAHALVTLDVSDPEHPHEVSRLSLGADEQPHWLGLEPSGRRMVVNSAGGGHGNRIFIVDFDPATGALRVDDRFRDKGATEAGVRFTGRAFPNGFTGTATPHGSVFSRTP